MTRPSDWYDDVFKVPSLWNAVPLISQYKAFMFGMKALPYVGDLARQADKGVPYLSTPLKIVPLLAPEYIEHAMAVDDSLGAVSMGLKSNPSHSQCSQQHRTESRQRLTVWFLW